MTTITIPKKVVREMVEAGRRFVAAQDALEDILLAANPQFIKKMRGLRDVHRQGKTKDWKKLKARYGL